MPRLGCLVWLLLAACRPTLHDPPTASYDDVFVSHELTDLVALPDAEVVAVGHGRFDEGTWVAHAQRGFTAHMIAGPGSRIVAALADDDTIVALLDGLETSSLGHDQPALLEHVDDDVGPAQRFPLDLRIDHIVDVAPMSQGRLLITSWRGGLSVVTTRGDLLAYWPEDEVTAAATFDDGIVIARDSQTSFGTAPVAIDWLTDDVRVLAPDHVDIAGCSGIGALVDAGPHLFAIAGGHDDLFRWRTSVGLLSSDGSWRELTSSSEATETQWSSAIAVGPAGELVAAGDRPRDHTVELRAWTNDGDPLWHLEFTPPIANGSPTYNDVCGGSSGLRLSIATDGTMVVGGHDGCSYSWMRVLEP